MGGRSSSSSAQNTETNQTDRRVGATDDATVVTEGSTLSQETNQDIEISLETTDDKVVSAALDGAFGFASAAGDRDRKLIETSLAGQKEGLEGLNTVLKSGTAVAALIAAVFIFRRA